MLACDDEVLADGAGDGYSDYMRAEKVCLAFITLYMWLITFR